MNTNMPAEYNKMVIIEGLENSTRAVNLSAGKENRLTYRFITTSVGDAIIRTYLLPNHPVNGDDIRYVISIDSDDPQIVSFRTEFRSEDWKKNLLRNQSVNVTYHKLNKAGEHTISIYALNEGVILDQIMLDLKAERKFYTVPINR